LLTGFLNSLQLVKEKSSKLDRGIYNGGAHLFVPAHPSSTNDCISPFRWVDACL